MITIYQTKYQAQQQQKFLLIWFILVDMYNCEVDDNHV